MKQMKKKLTRIIAIALAIAITLAMTAGCKKEGDNNIRGDANPPEQMFTSQYISLSDDINSIENLVHHGEKLYFTSTTSKYNNELFDSNYSSKIYTMSIDGNGIKELTDYTPQATVIADVGGGYQIDFMQIDKTGDIWIFERWRYGRYDLPADFDSENDYPTKYEYIDLESGTALRKLCSSGSELHSTSNFEYVKSIATDGNNNLYVLVNDYENTTLHVLDSNGSLQFELDIESTNADYLTCTPDGTVAFLSTITGDNGTNTKVLQTVDYNSKTLTDTVSIPQDTSQIHPAARSFDVIFSDAKSLYGFDIKTGKSEKLLTWLDSGVTIDKVDNIVMISEEQILCTSYSENRSGSGRKYEGIKYELITLTITQVSESITSSVLTLATFGDDHVREAVSVFNRTNPNRQIKVIDYSDYSTTDDYFAGMTKLNTEIIAGNIPDIIYLSGLPYSLYASKGLLVDLYPLIDADPDFNRSDFVDGVFRAAEIGGALYQIFTSFSVNTIIGNPAVLGSGTGWNMDEFKAVLDANPNADMPLGGGMHKDEFLRAAVSLNIDEYINWKAGTASFDTPDFLLLLEFINSFLDNPQPLLDGGLPPPESRYGGIDMDPIATGRQIMAEVNFHEFIVYPMRYKPLFGGDIVFKGFPTSKRAGNSLNIDIGSLAITTGTKDIDGAWQFLRMFLDKDYQLENYFMGFPTNKAAFNVLLDAAIPPISQEDVNQILALISSVSGTVGWQADMTLMNIITESAADYWSGKITAEDAARVIQSRASIYVAEQAG
ncbi:MAG: extracellular solute-binding protein [Oscillospiraceae bacterium]|nr:extracellular solute-binding protein [Oscillospiraceae bacterium]